MASGRFSSQSPPCKLTDGFGRPVFLVRQHCGKERTKKDQCVLEVVWFPSAFLRAHRQRADVGVASCLSSSVRSLRHSN